MQELDDIALLRLYAEQNSEEAFSTLVARHVNKVYSVALRLTGNPHSAEEITQAVFVILAKKSGRLGRRVAITGWLYQAARLTALTFIRHETRRSRREHEAFMQTLLNENESDAWPQIAPLLDAAMAGLNERDRHAVVLRFFDGKSMREVGTALGASEDAAKVRVSRAVEKLRRFFTKRGVVIPAAAIAATMAAHSVQAAPASLASTASAIAIAKGATASGSTLVLIQGTLKVMAWTKAKTATLATAAVVLAIGTTSIVIERIHAARVAAYPDIQGAWEGFALLDDTGVNAGQTTGSRVVLKLTKTNGRYFATADWIDLGRKDVPMARVVYDYPSLQFERNPRDIWNLKVNRDATEITWDHYIHFIQPDPVSFKRTATPPEVPERLAETDFAPRAGSDLQGYWNGAIGTGPDAVPVRLKISERADGSFRAEGDSPLQGVAGQPLSVTYNRPGVTLAIASGAGLFRGQINRDHTEISGKWIQAGQSTPATARRADYQAERAQDAARDYSFTSPTDLQGHWKGSWIVVIAKSHATIRLELDIAKLPDGTYAATLSSIDQFGGEAPTPPSEFQYDPPNLRMKWNFSGTFEGRLKDGKLAGKWFQGGGAFPLVFERSKSN